MIRGNAVTRCLRNQVAWQAILRLLRMLASRDVIGESRPATPRTLLRETDIDVTGRPNAERLTVEGEMLCVESTVSRQSRRWPLNLVADFRLDDSIGSCFLQARYDGRWINILRIRGRGGDGLRTVLGKLKGRVFQRESAGVVPKATENGPQERLPEGAAAPGARSRVRQQAIAMLWPFRGSVAVLFALSCGAVAIDVLPPMLQRAGVDDVLHADGPATSLQRLSFLLVAIVGGLLLIRLSAMLMTIWKGWVSSRVVAAMTAQLRAEMVKKLGQLPLGFYDRNQVGKLMSQVAYDTETLHTLVYHLTSGFLLQSLQLVAIGVMLFFLNAKLAAITILPMPLIVGGGWYFTRYLHPLNQHYWEAVENKHRQLWGCCREFGLSSHSFRRTVRYSGFASRAADFAIRESPLTS